MNKRKIWLGAMLILLLSFVGCGNKETANNISAVDDNNKNIVQKSNDDVKTNRRFINTKDYYQIGPNGYGIYYDSVTNIVYIVSGTDRSGITVMYDSDGKPMTLDKYNQTKDTTQN